LLWYDERSRDADDAALLLFVEGVTLALPLLSLSCERDRDLDLSLFPLANLVPLTLS